MRTFIVRSALTFLVSGVSLLVLLSGQAFAQAPQGVSYQAVARAADGTLLQNQSISVQLSIHDGSPTAPVVYQEAHTVSTNTFGLFTVTLGQGTTTLGTFATIDWANGGKYLETGLDPAGGASYAAMGTTQLLSVPYALYAGSTSGGNSTLDDAYDGSGSGAGKTITADAGPVTVAGTDGLLVTGVYTNYSPAVTGAGVRMYWCPDRAAFRAGEVSGSQWDMIGNHSFAVGYNTSAPSRYASAMGYNSSANGWYATAIGNTVTAGGNSSTAMGYKTSAGGEGATALGWETSASGNQATALGSGTTASGNASTVLGVNTTAIGAVSTAMGLSTSAKALASTVIGRYNVGAGNPLGWVGSDPLFEVGNGYSPTSKSNALTVLKNGNVGIGTHTPSYKLEVTGTAAKTGGGSWSVASDARLKNVDGPYMKGLDEILKLNSIRFHYKQGNARHLPSGSQEIGFIAQEVQEIFPEAVSTLPDGYLDFNIHPINVALVNAVQELKAQLDRERQTVSELKTEMAAIKKLLESRGLQPAVEHAKMVSK